MVTSRDVASFAGVSQATVSRVLRETGEVSESTRQKVLSAVQAVGYVPNSQARAMKTGLSGNIGVVVSDLANPFYPRLLEAVDRAVRDRGQRLTTWIADSRGNQGALDAMREGAVDGVMFTTAVEDSPELRTALELRSPVVLLNRAPAGLACDQVQTDNFRGGELVADHFVAGGHRDIGFIGGVEYAETFRSRLAGFRSRLSTHGIVLDASRVRHRDSSYDDGFEAATDVLTLHPEISALFCGNDVLATGAVDAARELGREVGVTIHIVGFDDVPIASWQSYRLTTVRQDIDQMATWAVDRLVHRVKNRDEPAVRHIIDPVLVLRDSAPAAR